MNIFLWIPLWVILLFEVLRWKGSLLAAVEKRLELFYALKNTLSLAPFLKPLPQGEGYLAREVIWLHLQMKYPEAAWAFPEWQQGNQVLYVSFSFQGKQQGACWREGKRRWGSDCGQSLVSTLLALSIWTFSTLWFLSQYKFLNRKLEVLWRTWSLP